MKKALVYLILCCTALPAGAQTLTLDECRAAAAEHNRTLRDGRFELEAALQTRREALTGYFPQVSATGGVFQAQHGLVQADFGMTIPQLGTMNLPLSMVKRGIVGGITAVQPVFAGLKIVNGNKLARLGEEVGRLQLQKTESEVREQTDAYYWQVVSLRDNLSTIEAVERQLEEIHRQVELSVKAGLVTTNDLLRVELRQQEIASNRLKVENGLKVSKMLLAQHIGVDWRAFDVAAAEFGQPEAPAAFYVPVEEALDNRAEYRLAEKNVEAQKYRKRMERGKRLPTVGVGAGYLYYNVTDKDVDDGLVFAQVSVPISDWWGGAHALKKARIREQQAENDRLQAREMLAVEIERTWSEVQESYAQILLTRRSVTSAAENLRQNRNFYQAGTAPLTDLLDAAGFAYSVYSEIKPNPTIANVQDGVAAFKAAEADCIVTIGGGSSMDTAKAIGIIINNPEFADVRSLEGVAPTKKHAVFTIAVPTTAGTAAEVTINYVITDVEKKRKFVCVDTNDIPEIAVVDPDMMSSMPKGLTAATGMDALTHAIEGYITKGHCVISDMFHLEAIKLISQSLRGAVQNTPEGREGMALGQYIAGMGFSNVGLGIVHSMAHGLSALYDTPHGVACAILLPVGLEYNKSVAGERYRAVGKAMGVVGIDEMNDVEAADATIAAVKQLSADVGIPTNLNGILKEEDIQFLAESAFADACRPGNPRDTSVEEIVELYKSQL